MEEIELYRTRQWGKFLTLVVALTVMSVVLGTLIWLMLSYAGQSTGEVKSWLIRSAILCFAMLGMTLIVLICVIMRFVLKYLRVPTERTHTEHVDAWSLAGKRFRLEDHEDLNDPDDENE